MTSNLLRALLISPILMSLVTACGTSAIRPDGKPMTRSDMDAAEEKRAFSSTDRETLAKINSYTVTSIYLAQHLAGKRLVAGDGPSNDANTVVAGIEVGRRIMGAGGGALSNAMIGMNLASGLLGTSGDRQYMQFQWLKKPYFSVRFVGDSFLDASARAEEFRERLDAIVGCSPTFWRGYHQERVERYRYIACTGQGRDARGGGYMYTHWIEATSPLKSLLRVGDAMVTLEYGGITKIYAPALHAAGQNAAIEMYRLAKTHIPDDAFVILSGVSSGDPARMSLFIGKGQGALSEYPLQ